MGSKVSVCFKVSEYFFTSTTDRKSHTSASPNLYDTLKALILKYPTKRKLIQRTENQKSVTIIFSGEKTHKIHVLLIRS